MKVPTVLCLALAFASPAASAAPVMQHALLEPVRLQAGVNRIDNIAGDGPPGTISLQWRENGNAWGYDIYTVAVRGSVATLDGHDQITDSPHTGEDVITSVRFARGVALGRRTLLVLIASREIRESVPDPAKTRIRIYALARNADGIGTPYEFRKVSQFDARRQYCNADMALKMELGLPLARSYSGPATPDGCTR